MEWSFREWTKLVDSLLFRILKVGLMNLPSLPTKIYYEEGLTPAEAVTKILSEAKVKVPGKVT